ncbi:MAG: tetratricopeptide repeat protein [Erythrobacter sp.]|uniref:tetratricopeptide repeat protein n=1 Tax=Erythrobacter sp. TaxID=1042 RepID=UPI0025E7674A|nr:tetratricopeptide repeat protein [Erythrobacter sp.]MCM0001068.1 tetratricopeptide repeat protein [Erythrobacter sp.]
MMVPRFPVLCAVALGAAWFPAGGAAAQEVVSQPVVQALPSPEVQRLNRALIALAKTPRDRTALVEAGQAALGVDDLEAAIGFFGRAADVDPGHSDVALGLGAVYLRAGRAGEALVQFDRALAAGADERFVLTDRALSLDLVGEQPAAQTAYARALELDPANDEARRRLAVSYAITGSTARFEDTLRPLLDRRDLAAQRARAFGLAIMGESDRAAVIVEQVMPRDIATRLVPYLGYMPRLTRQQQAAAANLGIFPRSADIGRDDPRLARFAAEERADSRLAPAGPPLDARPAQVAAAVPTPPPSTTVYTAPVPAASIGSQASPGAARVATVTPVAVTTAPAPAVNPVERVADVFADLGAPSADARVSGDAVDLTRIEVKREAPPPPVVAKSAEKPKPKPKEPPKPVHPSRVWVQVATGKKIDALAFDWRRIAKEAGTPLAPYKAYTARWGATNRLVAGPVASRDKAEALVRELKKKGLDVFLWLSEEGEAVQPLK